MNILFKKTIIGVLVAALALAALPVTSAFAQDVTPPKTPTTEQLEKVWAHQLATYGRLGKVFEDTSIRVDKAQKLIDKAKANGKDVTTLQSALNAFVAAVEKSRPIYDSLKGIITTHAGFDANGKVTDAAQAHTTVQAFRAKLKELHTSMDGTGKALREAVKAFREANKPADALDQKGS